MIIFCWKCVACWSLNVELERKGLTTISNIKLKRHQYLSKVCLLMNCIYVLKLLFFALFEKEARRTYFMEKLQNTGSSSHTEPVWGINAATEHFPNCKNTYYNQAIVLKPIS